VPNERSMFSFSFQIVGWSLFFVSAICFLVSSIMAGDPFAIAGSTAFLLANVFFAIALRPPKR